MIIEPSALLTFITATLVVYLMPGVDMVYIASNSMNKGLRAGLYAAGGIVTGIFIQASAAAFGMTALFLMSPIVFEVLRWLGVAYLFYLGLKILMSDSDPTWAREYAEWTPASIVMKGIAINILNPKIALFFLAFLPQFTNPAMGSVFLQLAVLGLVFSVGSVFWCVFQAFLFARVGQWFEKSASFQLWQRRVTGISFIGFASLLALSDIRR